MSAVTKLMLTEQSSIDVILHLMSTTNALLAGSYASQEHQDEVADDGIQVVRGGFSLSCDLALHMTVPAGLPFYPAAFHPAHQLLVTQNRCR